MPCERCRTDDHGERSVSSTRRVSKGDLKEFELSKWQRDLNVHNTAMHTQCYAAQRWLRSTNLGKHTARSMVHATAGGIFYKCHPYAEEFSDAIEGWVKDVMERSCHNQMELLSVIWLYDIHIYIYIIIWFSLSLSLVDPGQLTPRLAALTLHGLNLCGASSSKLRGFRKVAQAKDCSIEWDLSYQWKGRVLKLIGHATYQFFPIEQCTAFSIFSIYKCVVCILCQRLWNM